jgi:hypothetical protein
VNSRLAIPLIAGVLLIGPPAVAAAQDTAAAPVQAPQDSAPQGYAPAEPAPVAAPVAEPAPAAAPAPVAAPTPAAPAPGSPNSRAAALSSLGFVEILTPRPADRIQRAIEQAKVDKREAEAEYSELEGLEGQVKAMVEVKKQEVSTLDAQRKLAEKSKQEAEAASF